MGSKFYEFLYLWHCDKDWYFSIRVKAIKREEQTFNESVNLKSAVHGHTKNIHNNIHLLIFDQEYHCYFCKQTSL